MHEDVEHVVDRSGWPSGEWDSEPDRVDFISHGFACMLIRNRVGAWCGYVGVPESHPAFGKHDVDVDVHGGITYGNHCQGHICHIPKPGMPEKVWWLGFDTCHCGDYCPGMHLHGVDQYRNMDYTTTETRRLARQLRKLEGESL